jgi:hypothetical protein
MDTYKIFLKPKTTRTGDLGVINYGRMLMSEHRHHELFGKKTSSTNIPHGFTHAAITNIQQLFEIICGDSLSVTFTYCYKSDGRLYLCKTSGKNDDEKCKHAWLCNKLQGIIAAGIMQFSRNNDTNIIYIDNMSGTYKTNDSNLDIIKEDFENSFTNINIELIKSPNIDAKYKRLYCRVMSDNSVDYEALCGEISQDKTNKRRTKKTNKRRTKKTNKRRTKKTNKRRTKKTNKRRTKKNK